MFFRMFPKSYNDVGWCHKPQYIHHTNLHRQYTTMYRVHYVSLKPYIPHSADIIFICLHFSLNVSPPPVLSPGQCFGILSKVATPQSLTVGSDAGLGAGAPSSATFCSCLW